MRLALRGSCTKLVIACICVASFRLQSSPTPIHAQSAPGSASTPTAPQGNTLTRIGYKEDQGDLHGEMELQSVDSERRLIISFHKKNGDPSTLNEQGRLG